MKTTLALAPLVAALSANLVAADCDSCADLYDDLNLDFSQSLDARCQAIQNTQTQVDSCFANDEACPPGEDREEAQFVAQFVRLGLRSLCPVEGLGLFYEKDDACSACFSELQNKYDQVEAAENKQGACEELNTQLDLADTCVTASCVAGQGNVTTAGALLATTSLGVAKSLSTVACTAVGVIDDVAKCIGCFAGYAEGLTDANNAQQVCEAYKNNHAKVQKCLVDSCDASMSGPLFINQMLHANQIESCNIGSNIYSGQLSEALCNKCHERLDTSTCTSIAADWQCAYACSGASLVEIKNEIIEKVTNMGCENVQQADIEENLNEYIAATGADTGASSRVAAGTVGALTVAAALSRVL